MKTIAIDVDDVLAAHVDAFLKFSNERWGTRLTREDYDEHWTKMWDINHEEAEERANEFHDWLAVQEYFSAKQ